MSAAQPGSPAREIPDSQPDFLSLASSQDRRNSEDNDHRYTRASTPFPKKRKLFAHSSQQQLRSPPTDTGDSDDNNSTQQSGSDAEQGSGVDSPRSSGPHYPTGRSAIDGNRHIANFLGRARENVRRLIREQEAKKAQVSTRWKPTRMRRLTPLESGEVSRAQARATSGAERVTEAPAEEESTGGLGDGISGNGKHGIGGEQTDRTR